MFAVCRPKHHGSTPRGTPKIWAQSDPPLLIWASETFNMVTDSAMVTKDSLQETTIALSNGALADPLRPQLPPKWGFHMLPRYANGHISATGDTIHYMFGSRVGFSGSADRMALFTVRTNPRWRPPPCWKNFKWRYLRNRSSSVTWPFDRPYAITYW